MIWVRGKVITFRGISIMSVPAQKICIGGSEGSSGVHYDLGCEG